MCSCACARRITRSPRGIYTSSIGCMARRTLRAVAPIYPTFLCRELFSFFSLSTPSPSSPLPLLSDVPWPLAFYSISAGTFKCTYSLVHSDRAKQHRCGRHFYCRGLANVLPINVSFRVTNAVHICAHIHTPCSTRINKIFTTNSFLLWTIL